MKLSEKIIQLRKSKGMSQEQLATSLQVSRQSISKWELDEAYPDAHNLKMLANVFDVSIDYLLREELTETQTIKVEPFDRIINGIKLHWRKIGYVLSVFSLLTILVIQMMKSAINVTTDDFFSDFGGFFNQNNPFKGMQSLYTGIQIIAGVFLILGVILIVLDFMKSKQQKS